MVGAYFLRQDSIVGESDAGGYGTHDPARQLLWGLSRLGTHPSLACPRPPRGTGHHAVPNRGSWGPCPRLSGWPWQSCLVQCVPSSVVSAVRVSPDRALAGPPAGAAAGL